MSDCMNSGIREKLNYNQICKACQSITEPWNFLESRGGWDESMTFVDECWNAFFTLLYHM